MRHIDLKNLTEVLLNAIFKEESVEKMLHMAFDSIQLPMNYFDTSFRLIANALPKKKPFYFSPWEEMDKLGYAPESSIIQGNYLQNQEIMYRNKQTTLFNYGNTALYPQACGPVIQEGELIGYMGTMVEDVFPEEVIEANDKIIAAIAILHYKEHRLQLYFDRAFTPKTILLGDGMPENYTEHFSERYPPPYIYTVLCSKIESVTTLHYVKNYLLSQKKSAIVDVVNENYLYILICSAENSLSVYDDLEKIIQQYDLVAGISDRFFDPQKIASHRSQALLSLSLFGWKETRENIYNFNDIYQRLIILGIQEKLNIESLIPEKLKALFLPGPKEESSLLETLSVYIDCGLRSSVAAEKLGIHNNSVIRRLEKIQDLCDVNLKDPECINRLTLQLELIDHLYRTEAKQ